MINHKFMSFSAVQIYDLPKFICIFILVLTVYLKMEHSSEVSLPEMIAEVTVLLVSCCGTVLANIMVLINVTIKEKLHAPTYYYYLSLAVSDLILGKNHS